MPFSYNANIDDLNDAIIAAVNAKVASSTQSLDTRLNTVQTDVDGLETRATALENSEPAPEPTPTPTVNSTEYARTSTGMDMIANVSNITNVTLRISASPITTQEGWYYTAVADSSGNARFVANEQDPSTSYYWRIEDTANRNTVLASGQIGPYVAPNPTPPPTGDFTGGNGGSKTDQLNVTWSNGTVSSKYHVYAGGLDWTKSVGILVYGDGSGEYGLKNPTQSYLLGGTNGLVAVAKKHNLLLVTPMAPGDGCTDGDGVCWYANSYNGVTTAQKIKWSFDLVQKIYKEYNIDKSRVVVGGYSSGAQWTSRFFIPQYGPQIMSDGLFVPIAYGGAPASTPSFPASFKANVVGSWDTGTADSAYSTASYGAIGGYNWYTNNGFTTDYRWPSGVGHGRSGEFGAIMDREITQHLKSA